MQSRKVVVAIGVKDFKNIPSHLENLVPKGSYSHSSDHADLGIFRSRRLVVIGGRQSAFETAALLAEQGAKSVHVVCRHKTPEFTRCDFSFMREIIANTVKDPGWYRKLTRAEADKWAQLAFQEGRLKLEHWLGPRLKRAKVKIVDQTNLSSVGVLENQSLSVKLDNGDEIVCDHIIFATGFKPDVARVSFLLQGNVFSGLEVKEGSPCLDVSFQSSQKGLYFLGMLSVPNFGWSFGFSTGAPYAADILLSAISGGI